MFYCLPPTVYRLLAAALAALAGCATPIQPTGGPTDTTPPALVASSPASGAVRVEADRLVLTFSERVDEATLARALQVTPEFSTPPVVRVRGGRVEIAFPDSLRPGTTYVVTLGTELEDARGVPVPAPITLAFSTGERLDAGRIEGRLLDPADGAPVAGLDVFAYALADTTALPDVRTDAPSYRTQSGSDGRFRFDYLREGPFFIAAFEDRNRNRRADAAERFAAPARPVVRARAAPTRAPADSLRAPAPAPQAAPAADAGAAERLRLFVTALDTVAPAPRLARALSNRRLAVRFSEPVARVEARAWAVEDSASGRAATVEAVYVVPDDRFLVALRTDAPLPATRHLVRLAAGAARDSSGNAAAPATLGVVPSAAPDTLALRFRGFLPASDSAAVRPPDVLPGVRFNQPPDSLAAVVRVRLPDGAPLAFSDSTEDGTTYRLTPEGTPTAFDVEVALPDSTYRRRFSSPVPDALGGIVGAARRAEGPVPAGLVVEATAPGETDPYRTTADAAGRFALSGLPPGTYRLRLFVDANGNGRWDGGRLVPYAPPEPLAFIGDVRVRARWETDVEEIVLE